MGLPTPTFIGQQATVAGKTYQVVALNPPAWKAITTGTHGTRLQELERVYVNATGQGGIVDDTAAIQDALNRASALQYVKRGVEIVLKAPVNYYQVSTTLNLNELWNINIRCEAANAWNRSEFGSVETLGGNIHWIGNNTDSLFDFGTFCFGARFTNIVVNGRNNLKLAFDMAKAVPSVLRDISFYDCGARNCDFGAVHGDISGTDLAPVLWVNPKFSNNTSAAILNNSGNLQVVVQGGFITNNGFAPTAGNSWITDVDNVGAQILQRSGHSWHYGVTLDGSGATLPASGANVRCIGGTMHLDGWDDTPEVRSVDSLGSTQKITFGNWRHFDGSMTKANTPVSIRHQANFMLTTDGLNIFGDIEVLAGNQAAVHDNGGNFLDSASGFIGDAIANGGLSRINQSGFNEVVSSIGGDFIPHGTDNIQPSSSIWSRTNRPYQAVKARGGNVPLFKYINSNGDEEELHNAWFDAGTGQYKSIAAGVSTRYLKTTNGLLQASTVSSASANQTIDFAASTVKASMRKGSGPNGDYQLELGNRIVSFDSPAGTVVQGSLYFKRAPSAGGKVGEVVTTAGVVGSTAVLKQFGDIEV